MFRKLLFITITVVVSSTYALAQVNLEQGATLLENKRYDEARAYFNEANKRHPSNSEVHYYLGRIAFAGKQWDDAIDFFTKSVGLDPRNFTAHRWLGHAYIEKLQVSGMLKKKGLAERAKDHFMRAVELAPDDIDSRQALIEFYLEAPGIAGGSKAKARENIEVVKKLDVRKGHLLMAFYYKKKKEWKSAEREYLAVAAMEPDNPEPHFSIGRMYQDDKQFDEAFAAFEKCLQLDNDYMSGLYQIGRCAVVSGKNIERGIECLKTYLTLEPGETNPSLAWAHVCLGMLYEKQREFKVAELEYQAALELEPDHKEAKKALKKVTRR